MKLIIERREGDENKFYITKCETCNCKFIFQKEDCKDFFRGTYKVECPMCGDSVVHYESDTN